MRRPRVQQVACNYIVLSALFLEQKLIHSLVEVHHLLLSIKLVRVSSHRIIRVKLVIFGFFVDLLDCL